MGTIQEQKVSKQYDKILQEAKDELDLCGLEWKDEYLDVANHTPPFGLRI